MTLGRQSLTGLDCRHQLEPHTGTGKEAGARETGATQLRSDPPTSQTPTTRPEDYVAETGARGRQSKGNLTVGHITQPST
jgi:hypothetical protein